MPKRIMMHCTTAVDKNAVRRESIDGVEHIIVSSYTLPDDIVMNGGLYPAEEIDKSFNTLERTLAPIEHPVDSGGNFLPAQDPVAIHGFHAGAFNQNVHKEDNRIKLDKFVNVQEAMKTDRGRRLLDRIEELETNENARPIHTSTGVFLEVEEIPTTRTNDAGLEYSWIARNMVFDHDAILLNSVAAAQPSQGVGMAVNAEGDEYDVQSYTLEPCLDDALNKSKEQSRINAMSFSERHEAAIEALERASIRYQWIEELFETEIIFSSEEGLFIVPYLLDEETDRITIVGIPLRVERDVTYTPKVNQKGDAMKEVIVNALKEAGIEVEGLDDNQLLAKYNELQATQSNGDDSGEDDNTALADVVANALKPVTEELKGLKEQINAGEEAERVKMADIVTNSGKYPGLDKDSVLLLGTDKLKEMAANCQPSFGVTGMPVNNNDSISVKTEMPE